MSNRPFDHIIIIMLENQYRGYVMQNDYFRHLAKEGIWLENFFGQMHPSQTNYIPSIAGEHCGVSFDFPIPAPSSDPFPPPIPLTQSTIVDLLEESEHDWKAYMQSWVKVKWSPDLDPRLYPSPFPIPDKYWPKSLSELTTQPDYPYACWHNPFSMFENIIRSEARWNRIDNEAGFWMDVLNNSLPEYKLVFAEPWNDGHFRYGTGEEAKDRAPLLVDQAAAWLKSFFEQLRFPGPDSHLPPRTLVVVTYDEADFEYNEGQSHVVDGTYDGPNQIYTVLLGDAVDALKGDAAQREGYNHISLLRTVEKNFELGDLGKNDKESNWFQFLWGRKFRWASPEVTHLEAGGGILSAAAIDDSTLGVVTGAGDGALKLFFLSGSEVSDPLAIPDTVSAAELVAVAGKLTLIGWGDGVLSAFDFEPGEHRWSPAVTIASEVNNSFAVTSFSDSEKLMVVYQPSDGNAQSRIWNDGIWGDRVTVSQRIEGDMTLAALGPALFLIYEDAPSIHFSVLSYNVADFNVLTGVKNDGDTCQDSWSRSPQPLAHFSYHPGRVGHEPAPITKPFSGRPPLAAATLDGVIHLVHLDAVKSRVSSETFSLSGVMTAANPVEYVTPGTNQPSGTCPGWGTLAEAGWSLPEAIGDICIPSSGEMSMCRLGCGLALVYQSEDTGNVAFCLGGYVEAQEPAES